MNDEIKLGLKWSDKAIVIVLSLILGGVIGWYLPVIASWLMKLPFIPYSQFFEWIATLNNPWVSIITLCAGIIAGIIFIIYIFSENLQIVVNDLKIKTRLNDHENEFPKADIGAIYMDKKQLVFLGNDGQEIFRGDKPEGKPALIQQSFLQFGYPWKEEDPFEKDYFLWVTDHPDFNSHTNAMLSARENAIEEKKDKKIIDLQKELTKLGVVIKDRDGKQYVRKVKSRETK